VREQTLDHNRTPLSSIEGDHTFWTGTPERIAATILEYRKAGFHTFLVELPAPYDAETMETLITVVKPMVEAASALP
jgi:alkanesulfonate monooxygenase SsuD/methylene tetrahydromethanopterin reductase-like flavin-dependent oxidoreductase (luciferase family)